MCGLDVKILLDALIARSLGEFTSTNYYPTDAHTSSFLDTHSGYYHGVVCAQLELLRTVSIYWINLNSIN
jgi:hypothetical protein